MSSIDRFEAMRRVAHACRALCEDDQPGLRFRVAQEARSVFRQHRQLDSLLEAVAAALTVESAVEARATLGRFRDALHAHFEVEEALYFPALRGLRPDLEPELTRLVSEHRWVRDEVEALDALLGAGDTRGSRWRLDRLADFLADHERREERLLARPRPSGRKSQVKPA